MSKHTPTPWEARFSEFDDCWLVFPTDEAMGGPSEIGIWSEVAKCRLGGTDAGDDEGEADAKHIAKCVNSYDSLRSINKELVEACGPLLNEKALKLVGETAEASRGMNDIGLAIALEMLLTNHEKRRAVLTRAKSLT